MSSSDRPLVWRLWRLLHGHVTGAYRYFNLIVGTATYQSVQPSDHTVKTAQVLLELLEVRHHQAEGATEPEGDSWSRQERALWSEVDLLLGECTELESLCQVTNEHGYNVLLQAVLYNDTTLLRHLVNEGCTMNTSHCTLPLHLAAKQGKLWLVRFLRDQGADPGLEAGMCYPAPHTPVVHVPSRFHFLETDIFACDSDHKLPLLYAIEGDHLEVVQYLLEEGGAWPSHRHPLHYACHQGAYRCIQYLAGHAGGVGVSRPDEEGVTPLLHSVSWGRKYVKFLVEAGADVHATTYKHQGALHLLYAHMKHPLEVYQTTKLLLGTGMEQDVNRVDHQGNSALHALVTLLNRLVATFPNHDSSLTVSSHQTGSSQSERSSHQTSGSSQSESSSHQTSQSSQSERSSHQRDPSHHTNPSPSSHTDSPPGHRQCRTSLNQSSQLPGPSLLSPASRVNSASTPESSQSQLSTSLGSSPSHPSPSPSDSSHAPSPCSHAPSPCSPAPCSQAQYDEQVLETLELLLSFNCDANLVNSSGVTALHKVVMLVEFLLSSDPSGLTLDTLPTRERYKVDLDVLYKALEILLRHGAQPDKTTSAGRTALIILLQMALNMDPAKVHIYSPSLLACIDLLCRWGAQPSRTIISHINIVTLLCKIGHKCLLVREPETKQHLSHFIQDLLALLLQHGLHSNHCTKNRKPTVEGASGNILLETVKLAQFIRQPTDLLLVHDWVLTLLQWGADPDIEPYPSDPIICHSQSSIFLKPKGSQAMNQYMYDVQDLREVFEGGYVEKILLLFYYSMDHDALFQCMNTAKFLSRFDPNRAPTAKFLQLIHRLSSQPRSLKQIARVSIYKAMERQVNQRVDGLPLPPPLKDYLTEIQ